MSWTKGQLVDEAYAELALAGYVFDMTPEERERALRLMDNMVSGWELRGIQLGYNLLDRATSKLTTDSLIPDTSLDAVYLNLAIRIAAGKGKTLHQATLQNAARAYDSLLIAAAYPAEQTLPSTLPLGQGNRGYGGNRRMFPGPESSADELSL